MRNLPHGFDIYLVNVAHIFVAFSEKLNFKLRSQLCFDLLQVNFFFKFYDIRNNFQHEFESKILIIPHSLITEELFLIFDELPVDGFTKFGNFI